MTDAPTVLMQPTPRAHRAARTTLKTRARLSRAHVALQTRPAVRTALLEASNQVAQAISQQLGCSVTLSPRANDTTIDPRSVLSKHAAFALVELSKVGCLAVLELDAATVGLLLERITGAERTSGFISLSRIDEAALGWLLLSVLTTLRQSALVEQRFAPRLVGLFESRKEVVERIGNHSLHFGVELSVGVGDGRGLARIAVSAVSLQAALEAEPTGSLHDVEPQVLAAGFSATCLAGVSQLTHADLESLSPGDVIVFNDVRSEHGAVVGPCRLVTSAFTLDGSLSPTGFTLTRLTQESPMTAEMDPTATVDIEIELTKLRVTLGDLAALRTGAVLPLLINAAQPLTLRIGDKAVAKAELVDIEGELGARVLALL